EHQYETNSRLDTGGSWRPWPAPASSSGAQVEQALRVGIELADAEVLARQDADLHDLGRPSERNSQYQRPAPEVALSLPVPTTLSFRYAAETILVSPTVYGAHKVPVKEIRWRRDRVTAGSLPRQGPTTPHR